VAKYLSSFYLRGDINGELLEKGTIRKETIWIWDKEL